MPTWDEHVSEEEDTIGQPAVDVSLKEMMAMYEDMEAELGPALEAKKALKKAIQDAVHARYETVVHGRVKARYVTSGEYVWVDKKELMRRAEDDPSLRDLFEVRPRKSYVSIQIAK